MGRPPHSRLLMDKIGLLACLINVALIEGHRPNDNSGRPWSEAEFAKSVLNDVSRTKDVKGWSNRNGAANPPNRPANIIPLLRAFYGISRVEDILGFDGLRADEMREMYRAWRVAGGAFDDDVPPLPHTIEARSFSKVANIVDLMVSQPTATNDGGRRMNITLRIHPDTECSPISGHAIDIGVAGAGTRSAGPEAEALHVGPLLSVKADDWQPKVDTIFVNVQHPNVGSTGRSGAVRILGPTDKLGRIDGHPLRDAPEFEMEPINENAAGAIKFQVSIANPWRSEHGIETGFVLTRRDGGPISPVKQAVVDALFNAAFPRDDYGRLLIAEKTLKAGGVK